MAVEVTSKQLHHHVLPVVMVVLGLFGLAVVAQAHYGNVSISSGSRIVHALVARPVHVTPTKNGLAEISLKAPAPKTNVNVVDMSQTGRNAEVSLMVR